MLIPRAAAQDSTMAIASLRRLIPAVSVSDVPSMSRSIRGAW